MPLLINQFYSITTTLQLIHRLLAGKIFKRNEQSTSILRVITLLYFITTETIAFLLRWKFTEVKLARARSHQFFYGLCRFNCGNTINLPTRWVQICEIHVHKVVCRCRMAGVMIFNASLFGIFRSCYDCWNVFYPFTFVIYQL